MTEILQGTDFTCRKENAYELKASYQGEYPGTGHERQKDHPFCRCEAGVMYMIFCVQHCFETMYLAMKPYFEK